MSCWHNHFCPLLLQNLFFPVEQGVEAKSRDSQLSALPELQPHRDSIIWFAE